MHQNHGGKPIHILHGIRQDERDNLKLTFSDLDPVKLIHLRFQNVAMNSDFTGYDYITIMVVPGPVQFKGN